jgi:hypothetical protein
VKHQFAASCTAAMISTAFALAIVPSSVSAQVTMGLTGTLYFGPHYPSFVTDQPCHSYVINLWRTASIYPEVTAKLEALRPGPVDLTLSLQAVESISPDGRSSFLVTSVTPRSTGAHDVRKLCTSETPGGYYEGVLLQYRLGQSYGYLVLGLSGNRELYADFSPKGSPIFDGRPLLCAPSPEQAPRPFCD